MFFFRATLQPCGKMSCGFSLHPADSWDSHETGEMQWGKRVRYLKLLRVGNLSLNPEEMNLKEW